MKKAFLLLVMAAAPQDEAALKAAGEKASEAAAKALGAYAATLESQFAALKAETAAEGWNALGVRSVWAGDGDAAKYCFGKAVAAEPKRASAVTNLGFTLLRLKETEEAERVLEAGAKLLPENPDLLNNLAMVKAAKGEFEKALALMEEASRLAPGVPQFDYARAWLLAKLRRNEQAARLARSVASRPTLHRRAERLLEQLEKEGPEELKPEVEEGGEREPDAEQAADFIARMLRRRDELTRQCGKIVDEIESSWTKANAEEAARDQKQFEGRMTELKAKAAKGDKAASDEWNEMFAELGKGLVSRGGRYAICNLAGPVSPEARVVEWEREKLRDAGPELEALKEKKAGFTRGDAETALKGTTAALANRLRLLHLKATYAQHASICPAAFDRVLMRLREVRNAIQECHRKAEAALEALEKLRDDDKISHENYRKEKKEIEDACRKECARLQIGFRGTLANNGNQWKNSVDGHRSDVLKAAAEILDEFEAISKEWTALCGRPKPDEPEAALLRGLRALRLEGSNAGLRELQGVKAALELPTQSARAALVLIARAKLMIAEFPPRLHFTPFNPTWRKSGDWYEYATCLSAFDPTTHPLGCSRCIDAKNFYLQMLEYGGVDADAITIGRAGVTFKIGLAGTVGVEYGQGVRSGVSYNPFTGEYGAKFGFGVELGGLGGGMYMVYSSEEGLGWVAESSIGKGTMTVGEGMFLELPPGN